MSRHYLLSLAHLLSLNGPETVHPIILFITPLNNTGLVYTLYSSTPDNVPTYMYVLTQYVYAKSLYMTQPLLSLLASGVTFMCRWMPHNRLNCKFLLLQRGCLILPTCLYYAMLSQQLLSAIQSIVGRA